MKVAGKNKTNQKEMKKISYLFLGILGIMAASCEDALESPNPQYNPQNPVLTEGDIEIVPVGNLADGKTIYLSNYDDPDNYMVPVLDLVKSEGLADGAELVLTMEISKTEDFAQYSTLSLSKGDGSIYNASAYEWQDVQEKVFGKSIKPQSGYYRFPVNVNIGGTLYRYVGPEYYAYNGTLTVERMDPGYTIDENYYVFGPFIGGNTPKTGVAMLHDERDVYDNPNFTFAFEVSEDEAANGFTLLIAPEAVHNEGGTAAECYGIGDGAGTLEIGGEPIPVTMPGPYLLEANMLDFTYTLKAAPNSLYVMSISSPGTTFGNVGQLGTNDYVTYEGLSGIYTQWGLTGQAAYKPMLYVYNQDVEITYNEKTHWYTGGIMQDVTGAPLNAGTALPLPGENRQKRGLYYIKADLATLTYQGYFCETVGFVGSINNWGNPTVPDDESSIIPDVALKSVNNTLFMTWEGTVSLTEGDEWKIRMNSEWQVDFGGAAGNSNFAVDGSPVELEKGGTNFKATEDGTYKVTVNFKRQYVDGKMTPYTMTVVPL